MRLASRRTPAGRAASLLEHAEVDSDASVAALTEALGDPAANVRANAALALASLRDPASIPALAAVAAGWVAPPLARSRQAALGALAAFRSERAAIELAEALLVACPGEQLSLEHRSTLLGVAYADPAGRAAARVVRTLMASLEGERGLTGDRAGALLELFPAESVAPLVRTLRASSSPTARRRAAKTLRVCRHDDAVSALIGALDDRVADVRAMAARSLGEMRDPVSLEPLSAAAADPHPGVRDAAKAAIASLGAVAAVRETAGTVFGRSGTSVA
jgi:HEAT repeat protein